MSAEVAYAPPPVPEPPKHFATLLIWILLVVVGAILINQGMNEARASRALIVGIVLLAAGALLVFAGGSRVWPGKPLVNTALIASGVILLVASGTQLAEDWGQAAYAIVLTLVGIVLIVIGVQFARQSWKKYVAR